MGFVKAVKPCSCFCADTTGYFSFAAKLVCIVVDRHFRDEYRCDLNDCHKQYHHNQDCNRDVDISLATSGSEPFKKFFITASLSEQNSHVADKLPAEYYNIEQHHAHHQEERQPVNFRRYLKRNAAEVLAL